MTKLMQTIVAMMLALATGTALATDYEEVERRLGELVADGALSLDQAQVMLHALKEHSEDHQREEKVEAFYKWLEAIGPQLEEAVEAGKMTEDQAWDKWLVIKETQVGPKIKWLVKEELISEKEAWGIWMEIEMHETGERLKAAVERGEMTEEEAMKKWEAYEREMKEKFEKLEEKSDRNKQDERQEKESKEAKPVEKDES